MVFIYIKSVFSESIEKEFFLHWHANVVTFPTNIGILSKFKRKQAIWENNAYVTYCFINSGNHLTQLLVPKSPRVCKKSIFLPSTSPCLGHTLMDLTKFGQLRISVSGSCHITNLRSKFIQRSYGRKFHLKCCIWIIIIYAILFLLFL